MIAPDGIALHLLVADETGLPAASRRLEELPAAARAVVVAETAADVQPPRFTSRADLRVIRVSRARDEAPAAGILQALASVDLPAPGCFAWVAHESKVARSIRAYLREERGMDKRWIKAAGYWQRGQAGAHDSIVDDPQ